MSRTSMEPFLLGPPQRRLFAVYHPARGEPHGSVLVCPPLLQEHMRSHRFFSLLCERLAEAGLACLRFDYYGTGDSAGEDADFLPDSAVDDITEAAAALRARAGDLPLALLAVRASALFAGEAASRVDADALWLWLPVVDGGDYVRTLDAYYTRELASPDRYPSRQGAAPKRADDLMGFGLSPAFRTQLAPRRLTDGTELPPTTLLCRQEERIAGFENVQRIVLPEAAAEWVDEIDLRSLILLRDVEPAVQSLLATWPANTPRLRAHG